MWKKPFKANTISFIILINFQNTSICLCSKFATLILPRNIKITLKILVLLKISMILFLQLMKVENKENWSWESENVNKQSLKGNSIHHCGSWGKTKLIWSFYSKTNNSFTPHEVIVKIWKLMFRWVRKLKLGLLINVGATIKKWWNIITVFPTLLPIYKSSKQRNKIIQTK